MQLSLTETEVALVKEHDPDLYAVLETQTPVWSACMMWLVYQVQGPDWLAINMLLDSLDEYPEHE
ncbi:hypothetical protein CPT_Moby_236 [Stenotrophomonas phage Moby]|uniref:Uncharacterized protein n=1 Tax=Stenotrophomonas phage Moby TaxID=2601680 RepID=A0A5P8PMI9_9CAUD|nr:hypothetical protein HWC58_gp162 [Stenotrophomonas phage Moby]QFR57961.1 hypothetical protein CPT_Moby_236 [Stenotrophomonas phage Moby]